MHKQSSNSIESLGAGVQHLIMTKQDSGDVHTSLMHSNTDATEDLQAKICSMDQELLLIDNKS